MIPKLSLFISLIGSFCSSALALVFPPLIQMISQGTGGWYICTKNVLILCLALLGFLTGTYESLSSIVREFVGWYWEEFYCGGYVNIWCCIFKWIYFFIIKKKIVFVANCRRFFFYLYKLSKCQFIDTLAIIWICLRWYTENIYLRLANQGQIHAQILCSLHSHRWALWCFIDLL